MLAQYLGLIATISLAVGFATALLGLARMLRRRLGPWARGGPVHERPMHEEASLADESDEPAEPVQPEAFACGPDPDFPPPEYAGAGVRSIAILFLVFQAGALTFYLWGAIFRDGGLGAAIHMAWFALPLVLGLGHAWARGAFD